MVNAGMFHRISQSGLVVLFMGVPACHGPGVPGNAGHSEHIADNTSGRSPDVVVFIANETPANSPDFNGRYERLKTAAMAVEKDIRFDAAREGLRETVSEYQKDIALFSGQAEKDARRLEASICAVRRPDQKSALFVFTNQLTRRGKFRFCSVTGASRSVAEFDFDPGLTSSQKADFRTNKMPHSTESALNAALHAVKSILIRTFPSAAKFRASLVLKSHYAGDLLLAPKHSFTEDFFLDDAISTELVKMANRIAFKNVRISDLEVYGTRVEELDSTKQWLSGQRSSSSSGFEGRRSFSEIFLRDIVLSGQSRLELKGMTLADFPVGQILEFLGFGRGLVEIELPGDGGSSGDRFDPDPKKLGTVPIGSFSSGDTSLGDFLGSSTAADISAAGVGSTGNLVGVSADALLLALSGSGLVWDTIFFDSCDSPMPASLKIYLRTKATNLFSNAHSGEILFSNDIGLNYEVVNFTTFSSGVPFVQSLRNKFKNISE